MEKVSNAVQWRGLMFLMLMVFPLQVNAAGEITAGTELRIRFESQHHFNQKYYGDDPRQGSSNDGFVLFRWRVGCDFYPTDVFHVAVWMQHAEAWDMALPDSAFYNRTFDTEQNPNKDHWELWDTYLEVIEPGRLPISLKLGRQRFGYGDKRIFGPAEWGNTGRWIWDAAKIRYRLGGTWVDGYYGRTVLHDPNRFSMLHRHGFESLGLYGHYAFPKNLFSISLEPFAMTKSDYHSRYKGEGGTAGDLQSYYFGVHYVGAYRAGIDYDFTIVAQRGDYADDTIKAYGYHGMVAYTFRSLCATPHVSIEYSYASGDSDPNDGDHETFDGAFGAQDKMYGRMNLFKWMNLEDVQVNFDLTLSQKSSVCIAAHRFRLAERKDSWYLNPKEYRDPTGRAGDKLGKEVDIIFRYTVSERQEIQAGSGYFWPDTFVKKTASSKEAFWFFLQWRLSYSVALMK